MVKMYWKLWLTILIVCHIHRIRAMTVNFNPVLDSGAISFDPKFAVNLSFNVVLEEEERPVNVPKRKLAKRVVVINGIEVYGFGDTVVKGTNEVILAKYLTDRTPLEATISLAKAFNTAKANRRKKGKKNFETYPVNADSERFKLVYYFDEKDDSKLKLVYRFDFLVKRTVKTGDIITNAFVVVDAVSGKVVDAYEQLVSAVNDVMTGSGGNTIVGEYRYGEGRWAGRLLNITKDGKKCTPSNPVALVNDIPPGTPFFWPPNQCFDPDLVSQFEETCDPQTAGDKTDTSFSQVHDALFLATKFQELLRNMYGDETLQQNCGPVKVCTHFPFADKSFYVDSPNCETYYGVTGNNELLDQVSPSVIGHELGHAIIAKTSRLENKCQPGAVAEAFCDYCGIMLKASLKNFNKPDWKFGSEIYRATGLSTAIRYLDNPSQDGKSIDHFKDYKCQDVHQANGVYNKGLHNLISMEHWNLITVFQILLRANRFYWKPKSGFNEALCGLIEAARDYDYRTKDVELAFYKVGVACGCPETWITYEEEIKHDDGTIDDHKRISCMKPIIDKASWAEASIYCKSMNAKLVVLNSKSKSEKLKSDLPEGNRSPSQYWIGGSDLRSEDSWRWIPNESDIKGFTDWKTGEPNNAKNSQNCLALTKVSDGWKWTDEACNIKKSYVCELVQ